MKKKTYDIVFNDDNNSNNCSFCITKKEAKEYIKQFNGTKHSYFADYKGGSVSIICHQTGESVYTVRVK